MDGQELEQGGGEGGPRVQVVLSDHAGTQALERSMSNRVGDLVQGLVLGARKVQRRASPTTARTNTNKVEHRLLHFKNLALIEVGQ